jgi:hypothetical protein
MIGIIVRAVVGDDIRNEKYKFILKTDTLTITSKLYESIDLVLRAAKCLETKMNTRITWASGKSFHKFIEELVEPIDDNRRIRLRKKLKNDVTYIVHERRKKTQMALAKKRGKIARRIKRQERKRDLLNEKMVAWIRGSFVLPRIKLRKKKQKRSEKFVIMMRKV